MVFSDAPNSPKNMSKKIPQFDTRIETPNPQPDSCTRQTATEVTKQRTLTKMFTVYTIGWPLKSKF